MDPVDVGIGCFLVYGLSCETDLQGFASPR